ncbi:Thiopurine S-methyltransferase (EC 2.1.1.67) [uncultured Gammaproteobacteria bacterium]|nr:Thiopurine S-methyltransferase (EC 2.1.1.67) [uncultured Gammaproteobacteria bacterium]
MTDWIQRWKENKIGWHRDKPNSKLIEFIDCLHLKQGDQVFVPLCGKSIDMMYLLDRGYRVFGVELSTLATEQFFVENKIEYSIHQSGEFSVYSANNIQMYCGDYFKLKLEDFKSVVAVYDRASLIALPLELRVKYVSHLYSIITKGCRVLLLTLNYPQSQISGPPFAVNQEEVWSLYKKGFDCQQLQCFNDIENEPKFQRANVDFIEKATYCLRKK